MAACCLCCWGISVAPKYVLNEMPDPQAFKIINRPTPQKDWARFSSTGLVGSWCESIRDGPLRSVIPQFAIALWSCKLHWLLKLDVLGVCLSGAGLKN